MQKTTSTWFTALVAGAALLSFAPRANAQAWHYPEFQPPTTATREFNFAVAGGGDYGTTGIAQWREGIERDTHLGFDLGFASPTGTTYFLLGGAVGQRLMRATAETPIDMVLTAGLYGAFSSHLGIIRIPVGVSVGHRFPLENAMAVTPFVHPRLSLDACVSDCHGIGTDLNVNFDLGADWEITRALSLRGALTVGGVSAFSSKTGFGVGLVFHPATVGRRR